MIPAVVTVLFFAQALDPIPCDKARASALAAEARAAASDRQFGLAAARFQQAYEACTSSTELLLERANALFMGQKFADAGNLAGIVLRTDPHNAGALKIKGNAEYFLGNVQAAVSTFIRLLDRHPGDEDGAYMLGRIYYQEGLIDQAMGQFQRALRINPQSYKAWDNLGLCWAANADNEKAIAHFIQAIKVAETKNPQYDGAYANLADLFLSMNDAERAFAAASKAADRNSMSARNMYLGGKALEKLGKVELSINWLERSAALDPTRADTHYRLMHLYNRLGQNEKAAEARKRFVVLKAKEPAKRR